MGLTDFTVYDIYCRNAGLFGADTAVVCGEKKTSFADLKNGSDRLAAGLAGMGIAKGDRVALLAYNCCRFFNIFGAAAALGAVVVPINWRLAAAEIGHILQDSSPALIITDDNFIELAMEIAIPGDKPVVLLQASQQHPAVRSLDDLPEKAFQSVDVRSKDPFCIIYTAAMEGLPRGAVLSHGNIVSSNLQTMATMALGKLDVYLNMLPLFHITGLNLSMTVMHAGGRNVVMERFDAAGVLELTQQERVTILASFPPILSSLLSAADGGDYDLGSLSHVMGIDKPETIEAFEKKSGAAFWVLYGQTETSGLVSFSRRSENPGSAGRIGIMTSVKLVDDHGNEVPTGEKGEITVRGPLVFNGFWNQEEANRHIFRNDWHHTGDLGTLDANGYLYFAGRKPEKELIKPGGENVYPAEVEKVILEHPAVDRVSVIGVPDPTFGEGIKAVCTLKEGRTLGKTELIEFVADRIARYKKPRYVDFVAELPLAANGEIDREKVKALYGRT